MKQRFLLSILFVCSFMAATRAQIGKGSVWLGGSLGYSQSKNKAEGSTASSKSNSFFLSPAIGKAVKDNLIVGISATYGRSAYKYESTVNRKDNTYGGSIFVRRYIPIIAQLYIYGEAEGFYLANHSKQEPGVTNGPVTIKSWNAGIGISPGLSFGINRFLQIETGINNLFQTSYRKSKTTTSYVGATTESSESSFNTGISLDNASQIYIGFRFLLNKKA